MTHVTDVTDDATTRPSRSTLVLVAVPVVIALVVASFVLWSRAEPSRQGGYCTNATLAVTGLLDASGSSLEVLLQPVDGDKGALHIEVKYPNRSNNAEPTVLVVQVPLQAELEVSTVSANIDVHGVAPRELSLESVSGDIVANGAPRRASVESVSGDVVLTFNSGDVDASAVSGDLSLSGRLNGEVSVETVSGNMRVDSKGERLRKLSASTVSGDVELKLGLAPDGEVSMESVSGDLTLVAPRDLSAEVSGESFSGELSAPGAKIEREEFGPGSSFHTRYGAGKGEVRIETFSGDATLRLQ